MKIRSGQVKCPHPGTLLVLPVLALTACESIDGGRALPPAPMTISYPAPAQQAQQKTEPAPASQSAPAQATIYDGSSVLGEDAIVVRDTSPADYTARYYGFNEAGEPGNYASAASAYDSGTTLYSSQGDETGAFPTGGSAVTTYETVPASSYQESSAGGGTYVTADGSPYPELDENGFPVTSTTSYTEYETADYGDAYAGSYDEIPPVPSAGTGSYSGGGGSGMVAASRSARTAASGFNRSAADGLYAVHLASYRIEENARRGWSQLSGKYPGVLGGLSPQVSIVDLPGEGRFVRLIAGPYESRLSAARACDEIKARGDYCAILGFDGAPL